MASETRQLIATLEESAKFTPSGIVAGVLLAFLQLAIVLVFVGANGAAQ